MNDIQSELTKKSDIQFFIIIGVLVILIIAGFIFK